MSISWVTRALAILVVTVAVVWPVAAGARSRGRYEVSGSPANAPSWSFANPQNESGRGPNLPGHKPILMACRLKGAKVQDGNVWWYRIAARPWNSRYYVSADDFYNNGHSAGPLKGTPFVDPKVPVCP